MRTFYYEDTNGRQYMANLDRYRADGLTAYRVTIQPVQLFNCSGFYTVQTRPYEAMSNGDYECHILHKVARASKKADAFAIDQAHREITAYFERRGLVARRGSLEELAR